VLVATPIGNLGDLAPRAVEALRDADAIACEDTRRTGLLLQRSGVSRPRLLRADEHEERAAATEVVRLLGEGLTVAVVTDAGTPGVSDPGALLVRAALDAGHDVACVPGPTAAVTALVVSGLATDRWVMEGFVPRTGAGRATRIAEIAAERRTVVLYEAPHRLQRTLADLASACGADRRVCIARELTKLHEELWRGTLGEAASRTTAPRGEYVLVVEGAPAPPPPDAAAVDDALRAALAEGLSTRDAAARVAATLGIPRNPVYERALEL